MNAPLRIAYVEDQEDDAELARLSLLRAGRNVELWRVADAAGLTDCLQRAPDVILCDYHVPGFGAADALTLLHRMQVDIPLIVLTWSIGEDAVVDLFRAGARDYVSKDKLALLPQAIDRVLRERAHEREREQARQALARSNRRLREVLSRVADAQERERALVARELHDELGQTLTSVVLRLHATQRASADSERQQLHEQALSLTQSAIEQVRTLSFELRPAQLDLLGLPAALRSVAQRVLALGEIGWTLDVRGPEPAPSDTPPQAAVGLRIVREALTNAVRHSAASTVRIRVRYLRGGHLRLSIADDGRGFDPQALLADGPGPHNVGLQGMMERCESVGGRLRVRSSPGHGTLIQAQL